MAMTALLTMTAMYGSLNEFTPRISYTTKMDNWMIACIIFVLIPLIELVLVLSLPVSNNTTAFEKRAASSFRVINPNVSGTGPPEISDKKRWMEEAGARNRKLELYCKKWKFSQTMLDKCSLVVIFLTFTIFNSIYWAELWTDRHKY